eukprot:CAMPEP_0197440002 /NCGR_PEP_ID=MMETSP1175-20131217/6610_1 /TAXON_ID=1003142 /ORGANISM="Triceratium dubium, Strain CCMP147" /LENGTH=339 /DNA_ID=CAMNT_0042970025 /DNA_START=275 /DNA_END=1291 /DNA_ORIENTATION=-
MTGEIGAPLHQNLRRHSTDRTNAVGVSLVAPQMMRVGVEPLLKTNTSLVRAKPDSSEAEHPKLPSVATSLTSSPPKISPLRTNEHAGSNSTYAYELSAVVMFRVNFTSDLLKFSRSELEQWMAYMSYAGVEHFYAYDNCRGEDECQGWLAQLAAEDPDYVTYVRWPVNVVGRHKVNAYKKHFQRPGRKARFEIICDIDEYPFMPHDTNKGFLVRFAQSMEEDQTLIQSMFFGGKPDINHTWRSLRYLHREEKVYQNGGRTKYIYRTNMVDPKKQHHVWGIHWLTMLPESKTQVNATDRFHPSVVKLKADPKVIRLNHYWCERMDQDSAKVFDNSIQKVV